MPKKHVIITTTDEKFEDFVVNHWLKSLQDNVNLENIDVVIFDYGLRKEQVTELKKKKIIVKKYQKVYRVNNIRFRDVVDFLKKMDSEHCSASNDEISFLKKRSIEVDVIFL